MQADQILLFSFFHEQNGLGWPVFRTARWKGSERHTTTHRPAVTMNHLRANGLDFAYLEQGDGPLVILLHGFPDTANSWAHQSTALAAAGYRAVAPYLRGYYPTQIPKDGF